MNSNLSIHRLYAILTILLFSNLLAAQGSSNMTLLGNWDQNTISRSGVFYNDIWGYVDDSGNEYAILGSPQKVHFLDVTNPSSITLKAEFSLGSSSIWRDFKTYDRYVYGVADEGSEGLVIFDMNSLPNGEICQVYQDNSVFSIIHNIFIDVRNGFLYAVGRKGGVPNQWIVYDLKPDPANPTLVANKPIFGDYIHDIFVQNNRAYASSETSTIIFDVTDPVNPVYLAELTMSGYNHSSWIYEDGTKLITAFESSGVPLRVLDITNAINDDLQVIGSFKFPLESGDPDLIYHNPFILGDYAIVSSYYDGVTIIDVSNPSNPTLEAYYDTFTNSGYPSNNATDGCWGVYPFLPSGNIIAADTQTGLYVLSTTVPLPSGRCANGVLDPFEEGVDCGGFCAPCGTATVTCTTCSDGVLNGDETNIDCGGTICNPCIEDCLTYDFTGQVVGYDVGGNDNGTFTVQDAGATLFITGNGWKAVPINYTVTPNTVLEFDFRSDVEGEIHEIGFDNDLVVAPDHRIVVYGNQGYAGTFPTPNYSGSGNFEHFTINLGSNFTGTFQYLVLTCDDDANAAGDSYFSNVQIYEDYDGNLMCNAPTCPAIDNISNTPTSGNYQASNTITSDAQIMATENVIYGANTICLEDGFEVVLGGEFLGEINPCTPFTQAPNQGILKNNTLSDKQKKSTIAVHQMGNSDTWMAHILIEEAGKVEVYVQDRNNKRTTIFSDYANTGYLRLRFKSKLGNQPKLVIKTQQSIRSQLVKAYQDLY